MFDLGSAVALPAAWATLDAAVQVPEPSTLLLLGACLVALAGAAAWRARRRK